MDPFRDGLAPKRLDGGPAGSGQDTILVQFYRPISFTYNAPAIAGGDVVVHE